MGREEQEELRCEGVECRELLIVLQLLQELHTRVPNLSTDVQSQLNLRMLKNAW